MDSNLRWYSEQPGTPLMKAFCVAVLRKWLFTMYDNHLLFTRLVNKHLAHTGCQGNGAEVGWIGGVISSLLLAQ